MIEIRFVILIPFSCKITNHLLKQYNKKDFLSNNLNWRIIFGSHSFYCLIEVCTKILICVINLRLGKNKTSGFLNDFSMSQQVRLISNLKKVNFELNSNCWMGRMSHNRACSQSRSNISQSRNDTPLKYSIILLSHFRIR